jgi:Nucleoside diphosphate kinase
MTSRLIFFTTFLFTFVTLTETFQITKFFLPPKRQDQFEMASEQTFIAVKPDGVMRGLVGEIISRFEKRGLASF